MKQILPIVAFGFALGATVLRGTPALAQSPPTAVTQPTQLECLIGYPDGSFRGNRPLTRYEFAAGMAACLDQTTQPLETFPSRFIQRSEMDTVLQQQQELNRELQRLNQRVEMLSD